jgi:hypothetical protein
MNIVLTHWSIVLRLALASAEMTTGPTIFSSSDGGLSLPASGNILGIALSPVAVSSSDGN